MRYEDATPVMPAVAHLILSALEHVKELHGYAIREVISLAAWSFPITRPPVYPLLARLERQGFVSSRSEVVGGRHRKVYAITPAGRAELQRWLADPDAVPVGRGAWRDPMAFRIRLLDPAGTADPRAWLRAGIEYWEEYLRENAGIRQLEKYRKAQTRPLSKYMQLSMAFGMEQARARVAFYKRVLAEVERDLEQRGGKP
jgi:DNA-binding PadR family transcriptional regulator